MNNEKFDFKPIDKEEFAKGKLIKGLEVFKEGTYRGKKYTKKDLEEMVDNFHELKEEADFEPPVRVGHRIDGRSDINMKNLAGYVENLYVEEDEKGVAHLYADPDITDKETVTKIKEGTYKKRSSELGGYETNNGKVYKKNVFWGFGFVDIPQVEKLAEVSVFDKNFDNVLYNIEKEAFSAKTDAKVVQKAIDAVKKMMETATSNDDYWTVQKCAEMLTSLKYMKPNEGATMNEEEEKLAAAKVEEEKLAAEKLEEEFGKMEEKVKACVIKKTEGGADKAAAMKECGEMSKEDLEKFTVDSDKGEDANISDKAEMVSMTKDEQTELLAAKSKLEELEKEKTEKEYLERETMVDSFATEAKVVTAGIETEKAFVRTLSKEQFGVYCEIKTAQPSFVVLDGEKGKNESGEPTEGDTEENLEKKAVSKAEEMMTVYLREQGKTDDEIVSHLGKFKN